MDDELAHGAWRIDDDTRIALRVDKVRAAMGACAWPEAILEAEELLDEAPEHPEGLELLGAALLEVGDWELARAALERRVAIPGGPSLAKALSGLAMATYHLADLATTTEVAREAVRIDPAEARAHYHLGLALERQPGRGGEAATAFAAAAALEPAAYPMPVGVKSAEWQELIDRALAELHPRLRALYNQVAFRVEDLPAQEELLAAQPPLSPGVGALYVGHPPEDADPFDHPPEVVRLFARNLSRAGSIDGVVHELAYALREEALDWVGLELDALDADPRHDG